MCQKRQTSSSGRNKPEYCGKNNAAFVLIFMFIKFQKILDEAIIPHYAHQGDAGMDIFSVEENIIKAGERKNIRTGVKMELPEGFVGLVWDKSGLALKNGIKTMAGVIDSGYRGEIGIVLANLSHQDYKIEKGTKNRPNAYPKSRTGGD